MAEVRVSSEVLEYLLRFKQADLGQQVVEYLYLTFPPGTKRVDLSTQVIEYLYYEPPPPTPVVPVPPIRYIVSQFKPGPRKQSNA